LRFVALLVALARLDHDIFLLFFNSGDWKDYGDNFTRLNQTASVLHLGFVWRERMEEERRDRIG
jgi:hypothetical protein